MTTPVARSQTRLIALIVAVAFFMQNLDGAIIGTSLPQMAASFGVRPLELSVGITAYLVSVAALIPLSGWLSDRVGARTMFVIAIGLFTIASLGCGAARTLLEFVGWRVLQGAGGALMATAGRIIVLRNASKTELLDAMALITWPALIAPVIGPAIGGFLTTYASWRWNFLLNVPLGVVGAACVLLFVPNEERGTAGTFDWPGFLLSAVALIAVLIGLDGFTGAASGWTASAILALVGLGIGLLAVHHLRRTAVPLIDLSALALHTFASSTFGSGFVARIAINAVPFLLPLLFQLGFGLSAADAGLLILIYFVGNLAMKTVTTPALRRYGFRTVLVVSGITGGLAILACGWLSAATPYWAIAAILLVAGLSRSMQFTAINSIAFADIVPSQRGSATALSGMAHHISMVLGVAFGAMILSTSQMIDGRTRTLVADFEVAFILTGLLAVISALFFLRMAKTAGSEVSGHIPSSRLP